jgi:hypothetical protein
MEINPSPSIKTTSKGTSFIAKTNIMAVNILVCFLVYMRTHSYWVCTQEWNPLLKMHAYAIFSLESTTKLFSKAIMPIHTSPSHV